MHSGRLNARTEHDPALRKRMVGSLKDSTELYKKHTEDQSFQGDPNELIFKLTYRPGKGSERWKQLQLWQESSSP